MAIDSVTAMYSATTPSENKMQPEKNDSTSTVEVQPCTGTRCVSFSHSAHAAMPAEVTIDSMPRIAIMRSGRVPADMSSRPKCCVSLPRS